MELGNLIFGNSRGECEVPRTKAFEGPWESFCEKIGIRHDGTPEDGCQLKVNGSVIGNDVFEIRAYDWGAFCDCGADEKMQVWYSRSPHDDDCFQKELERRKAAAGLVDENGVMRYPHGLEEGLRNERQLVDDIAKERGTEITTGYALYCDCGRDKRAEAFWMSMGGHSESCRLVQPNFLFKPSGFRVHWYKYPFRDSYMTPEITAKEWSDILDVCARSVTSVETDRP